MDRQSAASQELEAPGLTLKFNIPTGLPLVYLRLQFATVLYYINFKLLTIHLPHKYGKHFHLIDLIYSQHSSFLHEEAGATG